MALTRKRERQLRRLRKNANAVWSEQRQVLDHANAIAREARTQLSALSREEVSPRLKEAAGRVTPTVTASVAASRAAAMETRRKIQAEVLPALGASLGTASTALHLEKNKQMQAALKRLNPPKKTGPGAGVFVLIGIGITAAAAVGYAVWQTVRADDDLWIAADEPVEVPSES